MFLAVLFIDLLDLLHLLLIFEIVVIEAMIDQDGLKNFKEFAKIVVYYDTSYNRLQ